MGSNLVKHYPTFFLQNTGPRFAVYHNSVLFWPCDGKPQEPGLYILDYICDGMWLANSERRYTNWRSWIEWYLELCVAMCFWEILQEKSHMDEKLEWCHQLFSIITVVSSWECSCAELFFILSRRSNHILWGYQLGRSSMMITLLGMWGCFWGTSIP